VFARSPVLSAARVSVSLFIHAFLSTFVFCFSKAPQNACKSCSWREVTVVHAEQFTRGMIPDNELRSCYDTQAGEAPSGLPVEFELIGICF
jgi:hypothetical protein